MKKLILLFLLAPLYAQVNNARMISGVNYQNGTSYTLQTSDVTKLVVFSNASAVSVTLPSGGTSGYGVGSIFSLLNVGAGTVSITCSSCTINGSNALSINPNAGADIYGDGANYSALITGGIGLVGTPTQLNVAGGQVSFANPTFFPGNAIFPQNITVGTSGNLPNIGLTPDPFCPYYYGAGSTVVQICNLNGQLVANFSGLGGANWPFLLYKNNANIQNGQVPAYVAANADFEIGAPITVPAINATTITANGSGAGTLQMTQGAALSPCPTNTPNCINTSSVFLDVPLSGVSTWGITLPPTSNTNDALLYLAGSSTDTGGNTVMVSSLKIRCKTSQKTESALDNNVLTCTPPAVAGHYRIAFSMAVSAQNTATLGWTATWKDSNSSAQAPTNLSLFTSGTAAPALTVTGATNGNYYGSADIDVDNSATAIVIKLTFTGTSFTAKVSATVEQII